MPTATLNLRVQPSPRLLNKELSATYCGLSAQKFEAHCPVRAVEMPDGRRLYDVRDLDAWIDSLKTSTGYQGEEIVEKLK